MNRILIACLIGAILALITLAILTEPPCPPPNKMTAAWNQISEDYNAGNISLEESIRRADKPIDCSQKLNRQRK